MPIDWGSSLPTKQERKVIDWKAQREDVEPISVVQRTTQPTSTSRNQQGEVRKKSLPRKVVDLFTQNTQALVGGAGRNVGEALAYVIDPNVRNQATASSLTDTDMRVLQRYRQLPAGAQNERLGQFIKNNIVNRAGISFKDILPEQGTTSVRKIAGQALGTVAEVAPFAKLGKVAVGAKAAVQGGQKAKTALQLAKQGAKIGGTYGTLHGTASGLQGEGDAKEIAKQALISGGIGAGLGAVLTPIIGKVGQKVGESVRRKAVAASAKQTAASPNLAGSFRTTQQIRTGIQSTVDDTKAALQAMAKDPDLIKLAQSGKAPTLDIFQRAGDMATKLEVHQPGLADKFMKLVKPSDTIDDLSRKALSLLPDEKVAISTQDDAVVNTLLQHLKTSARLSRRATDVLASAERSSRVAKYSKALEGAKTQKDVRAALSRLGGKLPKADYESLFGKMSQADIDAAYRLAATTDKITQFEKATATRALDKIFGKTAGEVPQPSEMAVLEKFLGREVVEELAKKSSIASKIGTSIVKTLNVPRALMASTDLSAPFRQGIFFIGRPREFFPNLRPMLKFFGSQKNYDAAMKEINARPTRELMQKAGVVFTDIGGKLTSAEESMMGAGFAEKLTGGKYSPVKASNRAYTGFLNKLRADVFDALLKDAERRGGDITSEKLLKSLGSLVNHGAGRGSIAALEKAMVPLNTAFFSPRLALSRIQLLNPVYYAKLDPIVRRQAMKILLADLGIASTVLGLAKMGGAEVGMNPTSADFGKIKVGDTRYDVLGGFQQYIRLASQLFSGKITSSTTGREIRLGEGETPLTRLDILGRFMETKSAPVASFVLGYLRGENVLGQKFDIPTETIRRFIPLFLQDAHDAYKEWGVKGIPMSLPAAFGASVQTYGAGEIKNVPKNVIPKNKQSEIENILKESRYFITLPKSELKKTDKWNESRRDLKGKEAKDFQSEMGRATLDAILQASRTPGWKQMTAEEKNYTIKRLVTKARSDVRDKWKDKFLK
jgi:hypothetical protein